MLQVKNVSFSYSRKRGLVLDDFSLDVTAGGVYGLLGPNGAGKSTLLYLIMGLLTPHSGEVSFNGVNTRLRLPSVLSDMFIVPEEFSLPSIPLERYIALNAPFYPKFSTETLRRNLEMFELPDNPHLGALSMGQKKKVFMSFALACNTSLLLMDEPTNGLDIPGKSAFRRFIASSVNENRAIIISTHQVRDIDRILDKVLIMNERNVVLDTSMYDIQRRLRFVTSADSDLIARALYMIPGLGGASMVLDNESGEDTEVNLEVLFDFAMHQPDKLNAIFNSKI